MKVQFVDLRSAYLEVGAELDAAYKKFMTEGRYVLGPELSAFENEFADYCGATDCVGVGSGTEALWLTLLAYGIGPGDEVITAPNSFIATVLAIEQAGAVPVLADVDPYSYNLDPGAAEAAITSRTRAIMPVHLFGRCAEMDSLRTIARKHGLVLIEDAAQAHGALYGGRRAGALGDAACFSFYPTKNLGAFGQGGAIVTRDESLAQKLRSLRNYGQRQRYYHAVTGYNSRLDDLQAAFLRVHLRQLDRWNAARRERAGWYRECLADSALTLPEEPAEGAPVYHLFVVRSQRRDSLKQYLEQAGVDCLIHYPVPIHRQQAFEHRSFAGQSFPVTERAAAEILSLPMHPWLSRAMIEHVADVVGSFEHGAAP
jgi:dTDP-4-amino-4,6-dideoxygalactose transaminase